MRQYNGSVQLDVLNAAESLAWNAKQLRVLSHESPHVLSDYWLLSVSDGEQRAKTHVFKAQDVNAQLLTEHLTSLAAEFSQPLIWFRLEWVSHSEQKTWGLVRRELGEYKRNYFRSGLAFARNRHGKANRLLAKLFDRSGVVKSDKDADQLPWLLCSEMELNAHACLYAGTEVDVAQLNEQNFNDYFKWRHGELHLPKFNKDAMPVLVFGTKGCFLDAQTSEIHPLSTAPRQHGRRQMRPLTPETLRPIIIRMTGYLSEQIKPSGRYEYGYFPVFGRTIDTYNTLRHASSTYALLEGYEFCCQQRELGQGVDLDLPAIAQRIEASLEDLIASFIRHYDGGKAYLVEINDEIKLGGNAVTILALVKFIQVFGGHANNERYQALAEALAEGIAAMQREDGRFVHILSAKDLSVVDEQRVIYYDGEAAFGLMRLFALTKHERYVDIVRNAFKYFIANHHEKAHDHWLSYCANELVQHRPEEPYFQFGVDNVKDHLDFIENRLTTYPTLLELCMAFHQMLLKLEEFPQFRHVLDELDVPAFYRALHARANYLLNGVFFPEMVMFFRQPSTVVWGGFIRHQAFRVRIDDVQHYLSGFVAYYRMLAEAK